VFELVIEKPPLTVPTVKASLALELATINFVLMVELALFTPMFCEVLIVNATVPLFEASCNTPEVSALKFSDVALVVPAETIEAMLFSS